jgi:hypothetical protein
MIIYETLQTYIQPLTPEQGEGILKLRELILKYSPNLTEKINPGKWMHSLLVYHTPEGQFAYALGPISNGFTTFHMMPYYGSTRLQEKHGEALKKFLSGKSCLKFKQYEDLPIDSIEDILHSGPTVLQEIKKYLENRKQ